MITVDTVLKCITFFAAVLLASNAFGNPNHINVIGLIPGVSTEAQIDDAGIEDSINSYAIGGYSLSCYHETLSGVLSKFYCRTGEDYLSEDLARPDRSVSNTEIHDVLIKGFTKKYGAPTRVENTTVMNQFGTKANSNRVVWVDIKGNKLTLIPVWGNFCGEIMKHTWLMV